MSADQQFAAHLAKIDELVAQNQAQSREIDGQRIRLHWSQELLTATNARKDTLMAENAELKATIATLEESLAQARELLLAWNRTNEHQLAELTRLYGIETTILPALQAENDRKDLEIAQLRGGRAPVRCQCKMCDKLAWEQAQIE